jgi:hypothetical protein
MLWARCASREGAAPAALQLAQENDERLEVQKQVTGIAAHDDANDTP